MANFALEKMADVNDNGTFTFYKLKIDGKCQFDDFCKQAEQDANEKSSLQAIYAYIDDFIDCEGMKMYPKAILNTIKDKNKVVAYEFKKNTLRVYFAMIKPNACIIMGGRKKEQVNDVKKIVKSLSKVKQLLNTL